MKYKINKVEVVGNVVHVYVEHDFASNQRMGFTKEALKLDPHTDKPRYLSKVEKFLELQYGDDNRKPKEIKDSFIGKEYTHSKINIGKAK